MMRTLQLYTIHICTAVYDKHTLHVNVCNAILSYPHATLAAWPQSG